MYGSYGITFDSAGSWSFNNETARNVIIFGVGNSSSPHSDNRNKILLVLRQGRTFGINRGFGSPKKKFSIKSFSKTSTIFCLNLDYKADNTYLFINRKKIFKLKATNKSFNFPVQFFLGSISNGFRATVSRKVYLNGNMYDFGSDYNSIDKSDI